MHLRILGALAGVFALGACDQAAPLQTSAPRDQVITALDEQARAIHLENPSTSLSVAVVRGGQVEFIRLYDRTATGQTVSGAQEPIFEAASLGKPVFAYLILKMVELEILSLERPLYQYAPDLFDDTDPRVQDISARMLLSHSAGFKGNAAKAQKALRFDPGTSFSYSGYGYGMLQKVLERRTGLSLETLARIHVFEPFNMPSTSFQWQTAYDYRIRLGYDSDGNPIGEKRKPVSGSAAWSLHTTAGDYAHFLAAMLDETHEPALKQMMIKADTKITGAIAWSLGWGLQASEPSPSIWHWGSNPGYRSYAVGYPKEDIGIVVLSNNEKLFEQIEPLIINTIGGNLPSYHWF
ncbi:D-aminopeptidase [Pseudovibrio axinellae]|uniref:D-aminopeptidase n=1 Tax=Pseudovibrio axinellae TaxID=989403 RepID=A0A165VSF1_9HYPH|nr:serine hydrolase domain-containing protein [Pseudovibrio axinellae]KZL15374.1 D-aminopeptidase [Pseudovibrio axinellae]SER53785.1 CubicO group peptidase, beta-lactamase class C family [Pseudovibrio axinellae]